MNAQMECILLETTAWTAFTAAPFVSIQMTSKNMNISGSNFMSNVRRSLANVDFLNEELFEKEKNISSLMQGDMWKTHSGFLDNLKINQLESSGKKSGNISFLGDTKANFMKTIQKFSFKKKIESAIHGKMFDHSNSKNQSLGESLMDLVDLDRLKERVTQISGSGEKIRGIFIIPDSILGELPTSKIKKLKESSLDPMLAVTGHIKSLENRRQGKGLLNRCQTEKFAVWLVQVVEYMRKKDYKSIQEYFSDFQAIFTLGIREIVWQIKTEIKERGELLELIWDTYIRTFSFLFETIRKEWFVAEKE